jgi:PKD repeat protein
LWSKHKALCLDPSVTAPFSIKIIQKKEGLVMDRILRNYRFNFSFPFWFFFFTLTFLCFFIISASAATQVTVEWDPSNVPNLAGYKIFSREKGQSYDYTRPCWQGTHTYCTIYDLDETKTYYLVARAVDDQGLESDNSNEVCQTALVIPNESPTADAGPDQIVNEGQIVLLNGSNSTDPDDGIASYHWVQLGGPAVALNHPSEKQTTFTVPDVAEEDTALTFELTVVDNSGDQGTDVCVVNVTCQNEPPQANAGDDQSVEGGNVVFLDGSLSLDIDDGIVSYLWTQTQGPGVTLLKPASPRSSFTAPEVGSEGGCLTFNLTVTDAGGLQNTDSCIVNISMQNRPPVGVVTPDYMEVVEGASVKLDGSASTDPDDGIASYLWTQLDGDPVTLSDPASPVTKFTAPRTDPMGKNLKFKLTVKDVGGLQSSADCSVYVSQQNQVPNNPPVADFSYATAGKTVIFTDTGTDSDGSIVSWAWNFGDGKTSTSKNAYHRYRSYGTYTVTLTVTDDQGATDSTSKTVTLATTNWGWWGWWWR